MIFCIRAFTSKVIVVNVVDNLNEFLYIIKTKFILIILFFLKKDNFYIGTQNLVLHTKIYSKFNQM